MMTIRSSALVLISGNRLLILNERLDVRLVKLTLLGRLVIILSKFVSLFGAVPGNGWFPTPLRGLVARRPALLTVGMPVSDVDSLGVLVPRVGRVGRAVRSAKTVHSPLITVLNVVSRWLCGCGKLI